MLSTLLLYSLVEGWYRLTSVLKFGVLKSTQFIQLYFGISEQIKPLQRIGQVAEFKFESKFEPLIVRWPVQVIWQSFPKAIPEDIRRFWLQNQWPRSCGPLWQRSGTSWSDWTCKHEHRAFSSQRQSLLAATGSLEENVLPLLRYWLSSTVKKVLMLCRYRAATSHFFFHAKRNFRWNWREVVADQSSAHRFAQSLYQSLDSE